MMCAGRSTTVASSRGSRSGSRRAAIVVCASAVIVLAVSAVAGFVFHHPEWTGLGNARLPMAPSTAALFVWHGVALALLSKGGEGRRIRWLVYGMAAVASVVASVLLVLAAAGIRPRLEHLGMAIEGQVRGIPIGHISPVTAGGFLLASIALGLVVRAARSHGPLAAVAKAISGILIAAALVFVLAYGYGKPLMHEGGFIPPALNTSLAFVALGAGLLLVSVRGTDHAAIPLSSTRKSGAYAAGYLLFAVGIIVSGSNYQRGVTSQYRSKLESELASISELKISEIALWREERLGDGSLFLDNWPFAEVVEDCIGNPNDDAAKERLREWLYKERQSYGYDRVFVWDTQGAEVAAEPEHAEASESHLLALLPSILRGHDVSLMDFHREESNDAIRLSVLVPLYSVRRPGQPLGLLVLRIDPEKALYPILRRWPTPTRSAETLLVRRDGEDVLYLNDLRFHPGAAMSLRIGLAREEVPAVQGVLGRTGILEGVDYKGSEVVAYAGPVEGTPWTVVTRMDSAELFGPLAERMWLFVLLVSSLLLTSGSAVALIWRNQRVRFFREQAMVAEELRVSREDLQQRNEELTRFTYAVSHDLKSPLVTIQTFAGYLDEDIGQGDSESIRKDLDFIRGAAGKMSTLLDELLELSRVGRIKNPDEEFPLQDAVNDAQRLVAGRIAASGVSVGVTDEPIVLRGDRVRIVEVFQNLIDNAVKFMGDQEEPHIEVGFEESNGEIVLLVRDNGIGIDPRHISKIFGLFEKLDARTEGTGMGLALVRRIVEIHRGRIWAESAGPGQGTCIRFTLAGTRIATRKRS